VTQRSTPYVSPSGLRRDVLPFKLWEKAKRLVWDPADIDFSSDAAEWPSLEERWKIGFAAAARGFMIGEEAVTLDILPLLRAMADEGSFEDTMYLTTFAFEEAKHVDFFTRWFEAIGFDPHTLDGYMPRREEYGGPRIIDDELPRVMRRLDADRSPEAIFDAAFTYNQYVEAVLAIVGYTIWRRMFAKRDVLHGFQEGIGLVQLDERRHIAYGTYLCRRLIAEHAALWPFAQRRMSELLEFSIGGTGEARSIYGDRFEQYADLVRTQADRRMQLLAAARTLTADQVDAGTEEELVPDLLVAVAD
jgi:ribonucleoside-diphosphate reductase beta chain